MTEYKNIKFKTNLPYVCRLKYDKPKEKTGEFGDYWIYGVEYEGENYTFIANLNLHTMLSKHKKGDLLEIMKVEDDDKKSHFEVELLSEKDIKSTGSDTTSSFENKPDWDKINADKQHSIVLQVAMKLAVQSLPAKAKLTDKDYEEVEVRMVKFNAIMEKYLGVVMKGDSTPEKSKINVFVQKKADLFKEFLKDNKDKLLKDIYDTAKKWIDDLDLEKTDTKQLTVNLDKIKNHLKSDKGKYESHHEELITACCETLKTEDRLPVIQTLTNIVKSWKIDGLEKLSETTENQCIDLLAAFDKQQISEQNDRVPY